MNMSLQDKLDRLTLETEQQVPPEIWEMIQAGYKKIIAQDLETGAVQAGSTAPEFTLQNATGELVSLKELVGAGNVVLTFYRGSWCPYCNLTLHAYQEALSDIASQGAQLVAISPQTPDHSLSQKEKENLSFEVLSDPRNEVALKYGLRFEMPEEHIRLLDELGMPYSSFTGNDDSSLPLSATFVINEAGEIIWQFVERNYRKRAEPAEIINALEQNTG